MLQAKPGRSGSNISNKIHRSRGPPFSRALYSSVTNFLARNIAPGEESRWWQQPAWWFRSQNEIATPPSRIRAASPLEVAAALRVLKIAFAIRYIMWKVWSRISFILAYRDTLKPKSLTEFPSHVPEFSAVCPLVLVPFSWPFTELQNGRPLRSVDVPVSCSLSQDSFEWENQSPFLFTHAAPSLLEWPRSCSGSTRTISTTCSRPRTLSSSRSAIPNDAHARPVG